MTLYVFDTDLLSLYQRNHQQVCNRILLARQNGLTLTTTVVTVEEQYGGRLSQISSGLRTKAPSALNICCRCLVFPNP
jgi:hypothetical protein